MDEQPPKMIAPEVDLSDGTKSDARLSFSRTSNNTPKYMNRLLSDGFVLSDMMGEFDLAAEKYQEAARIAYVLSHFGATTL